MIVRMSSGSSLIVVGLAGCLLSTSCGSGSARATAPSEGSKSAVVDQTPSADAGAVGPARWAFRLSPDGQRVGFLRSDQGATNLWVGQVAAVSAAEPVTSFADDTLATYAWAHTNRHVIYQRGPNVVSLDLATGATVDLTPPGRRVATLFAVGAAYPQHVLIGATELYRADIVTGELTLVQQDAGFDGYYVDGGLRPRLAYREQGERRALFHVDRRGGWRELAVVSSVVGFDEIGTNVLALDGHALVSLDLVTGEVAELARDVAAVLVHPRTGALQAAAIGSHWPLWQAADEDVHGVLTQLKRSLGAAFEVLSRSLDDQRWLVSSGQHVFVFDRERQTLDPIVD